MLCQAGACHCWSTYLTEGKVWAFTAGPNLPSQPHLPTFPGTFLNALAPRILDPFNPYLSCSFCLRPFDHVISGVAWAPKTLARIPGRLRARERKQRFWFTIVLCVSPHEGRWHGGREVFWWAVLRVLACQFSLCRLGYRAQRSRRNCALGYCGQTSCLLVALHEFTHSKYISGM